MFNWLTGDRRQRLQEAYAAKMREAKRLDRRSDAVRHAKLVAEARVIARHIQQDCVPLV